MTKKNKVAELMENDARWYYRVPALVAVAGVIIAITGLFKGDHSCLIAGGIVFLVGLAVQWVLGFNHFIWTRKK